MSEEQAKKIEEKPQFLGKIDDCGERAEYHNLVDILFVIDATGSMGWCISQMKKTVCKIMKKFSDKQYNIKFAIELYRDHPPQQYSYIEKHFDLRNQDAIILVIDKQCDVGGGGDLPEAVFDGLVNGLKKTSWRISTDGKTKSKRFLFHGCDAPPHGKQYGSTSSDIKWTENGCPCGLTRHDVKKLLNEFDVDYSLIKCGNDADVMGTLFKQCFSERFKRQLQIKNDHKSYFRIQKGGKMKRKTSECYMKQIQLEEQEGSIVSSGGDSDNECDERHVEAGGDQLCLAKQEKKTSILSSIKKMFTSESKNKQVLKSKAPQNKKRRRRSIKLQKKQKEHKEKGEDSDSDDSQKGGKPRSMASLVLSDIQDGVQSYFEEKVQKKQKS